MFSGIHPAAIMGMAFNPNAAAAVAAGQPQARMNAASAGSNVNPMPNFFPQFNGAMTSSGAGGGGGPGGSNKGVVNAGGGHHHHHHHPGGGGGQPGGHGPHMASPFGMMAGVHEGGGVGGMPPHLMAQQAANPAAMAQGGHLNPVGGGGPGGVDLPAEVMNMYVPNSAVGALIGAKGSYIRDLNKYSGFNIKIAQSSEDTSDYPAAVNPADRRVTMTGPANRFYLVRNLVTESKAFG